MSGVTGLTSEVVELPGTLTRTVANGTAGNNFYVAVPATYSVQQIVYSVLPFPMNDAETITVDGISYKMYKSSQEGGYLVDDFLFTITVV